MTRDSNDCLSRRLTHWRRRPRDFHSLRTKGIVGGREQGMESETRTTECEGRVMFSLGHVAIFPFGKRWTVYRDDGDCCNVTSLVLTRYSNVRHIFPGVWKQHACVLSIAEWRLHVAQGFWCGRHDWKNSRLLSPLKKPFPMNECIEPGFPQWFPIMRDQISLDN